VGSGGLLFIFSGLHAAVPAISEPDLLRVGFSVFEKMRRQLLEFGKCLSVQRYIRPKIAPQIWFQSDVAEFLNDSILAYILSDLLQESESHDNRGTHTSKRHSERSALAQ
jgi:hypothetical protein